MRLWTKLAVVAVSLTLVAGGAVADISIVLNTDLGALMIHNGGTTYPDNALPSGSMIQVIWSTVNAYAGSGTPFAQSDAQGNNIVQPSMIGSGYYLLWTGYTPVSANPGTIESGADIDGNFDYDNADVGGNNINSGYLYVRIFEAADPALGTWYASSQIYNTSTFAVRPPPPGDPIPAATFVDVCDSAPSAIEEGGGFWNQANHGQVVPEPSTMALALAGVGLLIYRRFRK